MITKSAGLLPGTLDLLILKAVSLDCLHGYGVLLRIQQISRDAFNLRQGSLYSALNRLERQRLIKSKWGESESRRRAKYYRLTLTGRRRLNEEVARWEGLAVAMATALRATPQRRRPRPLVVRAIRTLRAAVNPGPADRVAPLSPKMVGLRFQAAARAAGVEHVTAHSGRVGLASELTSRGASTTDVMLAGNWKTSRMVAHYSAGATAERGAVARYL